MPVMGGLEAVTLFRQFEEGVLPKEITEESKGETRTSPLTPATDDAYLTPRAGGSGKDQSATNSYNKNIKVPAAVVTQPANARMKRQFIIGMSANGEVRRRAYVYAAIYTHTMSGRDTVHRPSHPI